VKRKGILEHYSSKRREMTMSPYCSGFLKLEEPGQELKDMVKAIYSMGLGVACFASIPPLYAGSRHVEPDAVQHKGDKVDKEFYTAKDRLAAIQAATIYLPRPVKRRLAFAPMGRVRSQSKEL
jgi:hypothetical protein